MTLKHWLVGAAGALALSTLPASVQAAPLGAGPEALKGTADQNRATQEVVWVRRCWWHRGHRHCRRVWRDSGYYDPGYYYEPYPYSYGPSFGFSFGGRGHHHHRGHHHRGHRR